MQRRLNSFKTGNLNLIIVVDLKSDQIRNCLFLIRNLIFVSDLDLGPDPK
jgi:hypothetical protein